MSPPSPLYQAMLFGCSERTSTTALLCVKQENKENSALQFSPPWEQLQTREALMRFSPHLTFQEATTFKKLFVLIILSHLRPFEFGPWTHLWASVTPAHQPLCCQTGFSLAGEGGNAAASSAYKKRMLAQFGNYIKIKYKYFFFAHMQYFPFISTNHFFYSG